MCMWKFAVKILVISCADMITVYSFRLVKKPLGRIRTIKIHMLYALVQWHILHLLWSLVIKKWFQRRSVILYYHHCWYSLHLWISIQPSHPVLEFLQEKLISDQLPSSKKMSTAYCNLFRAVDCLEQKLCDDGASE